MSRPTCWECGKQLMYVKDKPVWAVVVEDGVEHRVHKDCKEWRSHSKMVGYDAMVAHDDVLCALRNFPLCAKKIRSETE